MKKLTIESFKHMAAICQSMKDITIDHMDSLPLVTEADKIQASISKEWKTGGSLEKLSKASFLIEAISNPTWTLKDHVDNSVKMYSRLSKKLNFKDFTEESVIIQRELNNSLSEKAIKIKDTISDGMERNIQPEVIAAKLNLEEDFHIYIKDYFDGMALVKTYLQNY